MADYHIYLHNDSDNSPEGKFKPQAVKNAESESGSGGSSLDMPFKTMAKKGMNFIRSGGNVVSPVLQEIGSKIPFVATALAALKITDKIVNCVIDNVNEYTGHYEHSLRYNNLKNAVSWVTSPLHQVDRLIKRQWDFKKTNLEVEQKNTLIGNSTFKHTRRGV